MRYRTQVPLIIFCACFAVALALSVAMACSRYIENDLSTPQESVGGGFVSEGTVRVEQETPAIPSANGLRFISNGDGTCVLAGIGSCSDACVVVPEYAPNGDRVTAVAAMALYQCTTVTMLQLPASVVDIGGLAFADCPNLVYISVSAGNPNYRDVDGVLYTADESTLILYPAKRTGSTVRIRAVTTKIEDMAFYSCVYLTRVSYGGTAEQWEEIRIGFKNYSLSAAAKSFGQSETPP